MKRSYKDIALVCENLSLLYESGISLIESVRLLKEVNLKKDYYNSIDVIEKSLLKGNTLSKSFGIYPKLYPSFFRSFINVGESNGKLSKVLNNLKEYYNKRENLMNRIKGMLAYPIFLIIILGLLSIAAIFILVPIIYEMFYSTGKVNLSIKEIYDFSNAFIDNPCLYLLYFICYFIFVPILLFLLLKNKIHILNILLKINVVSNYYENIIILILSIIFESEVSIVEGISECSRLCNEKVIRKELIKIKKDLLEGKELSEALQKCKFISKSSISMIKIGEKGGKINEVVSKLEEITSVKLKKKIDSIVSKMQPVTLLIVASFVMGFICKFILPVLEVSYL